MNKLKNFIKKNPLLNKAARMLYGWIKLPARQAELQTQNEALSARLARIEEKMEQGGQYNDLKTKVAFIASDLEAFHRALKDKAGNPEEAAKQIAGHELTLDTHFYLSFENHFRGPQDVIEKIQAQYLPDLQKAVQNSKGEYLLDVGCGRGEFLKLMAANKIPAKGVDITKSMIETCHGKGLDAVHGDTLQYLNTLKDDCLIGMTAFQVVEHVPTDYLVRMIKTAFRKIAPGGVLILETVNSDSLNSLRNFYLDLTHRNPIPPATLKFVAEYAGFKDVRLHYSSLVAEESRLQGGDDNTRKLNDLLFAPQDYAVIGWR
jgi:O-antigen chain-terminating methyltransferase